MDPNGDLVQQILIVCVFMNCLITSSDVRGAREGFLLFLLQLPNNPCSSDRGLKARIKGSVFRHHASFSHAAPPLLFSDFQTPAIPVSGISWGELVSCDELCIHFVMGASSLWGRGLTHSSHLWLGLNLNLFLQQNSSRTWNYYVSSLLINCYFMNNNWDQ